MENETNKLISEQIKELPGNLRIAIDSIPWKSLIHEIAQLHNLSLDQSTILERETMFILYQFENVDDYIDNIIRETHIEEVVALAIAGEVDERIFKLIAEKVESIEPKKPNTFTDTTPPTSSDLTINTPNLPMVEAGEVAHEVPHVEMPLAFLAPTQPVEGPVQPKVSEMEPVKTVPKMAHYPGGVDPYREPLN